MYYVKATDMTKFWNDSDLEIANPLWQGFPHTISRHDGIPSSGRKEIPLQNNHTVQFSKILKKDRHKISTHSLIFQTLFSVKTYKIASTWQ